MAEAGASKIKQELGEVLFDPAEPNATDQVMVPNPDTATFNDVQALLEKYFKTNSTVYAVTLVAANERLGVVSRNSLGPPGMTVAEASGPYELGAGERLSLPGTSTRYKLLRFRCRQCSAETFGMHYDARVLEPCAQGHRQWEFQREN